MDAWLPAIRISDSARIAEQPSAAGRMAKPTTHDELDRRVAEYLPRALRLARRLCDDDETAEEAVQEALVRVARSWRRFRGLSAFETWMGRIVIRSVRDCTKRRRRPRPLSLADVNPPAGPEYAGPERQAMAAELADRVRRAVARLPERQREVLVLVAWEGLASHEVARLLRITTQNVYANLHAARKRLRQELGESPASADEGGEPS